jgi:hypothetical protein
MATNSSDEGKKITEESAPTKYPTSNVIPRLRHRLSVMIFRLWYVTQLHYLYRALLLCCEDGTAESGKPQDYTYRSD